VAIVYKFFGLGRPPKLEKIEKSKRLQERIKRLNKIKNYYIKNNLSAPDWSGLNEREVAEEIGKIELSFNP